MQLNFSTQHHYVATAIDSLCHPPLSCAILCKLHAILHKLRYVAMKCDKAQRKLDFWR